MSHEKPTQEELDAQTAAAAAKIDEMDAAAEAEAKEVKEAAEATAESSPDAPKTPPEGEDKNKAKDDDQEDQTDWRSRYAESTSQAQILHSKNKRMNEAIAAADSISEPTDEELKSEFSDWDDLTPTEQRLAKSSLINERKIKILTGVTAEIQKADVWVEKVSEFVGDPKVLDKFPDLEGQEAEFTAFAIHESRMGANLEDTVAAYLYTARPVKKRGKLMPSGTGGPITAPKDPTKISAEQGRKLRETDYKKWVDMNNAGKIQSDI